MIVSEACYSDASYARLVRDETEMRLRLHKHFCFLLLGLFCLISSGCGFHLRGFSDFPRWLDNIAIVIQNTHPDLETLLKAQFEFYHKMVCNIPSQASYLLVLEEDNYREQITNVSASTTPRIFLLTYTVKFSLLASNGRPILASSTVRVTRQLTINNNRLLGSDLEEAVLKNELRKEAAVNIANRLSFVNQRQ